MIAPGTYNENVIVNKSVSLVGAGPGVIVQGTFETDNGITGDVNVYLRDHGYNATAGTGIAVSATSTPV